jgi:hypothetical protein
MSRIAIVTRLQQTPQVPRGTLRSVLHLAPEHSAVRLGAAQLAGFSSLTSRQHTWRPDQHGARTSQHFEAQHGASTLASSSQSHRQFHTTSLRAGPKRDPYDVLGVSRTASKDEVKKSYYKLVKK